MNEETLLPPRLASRDESFQRNYADLASKLVEFGDLADDNGLGECADKVAALMPRLAILRVAQYEGFTNYWIANGRAFERAYKEKASKPGASPHEAWWAVLEEFQDSLGGNQSKFNEKYALKNSDDYTSRHLVEAIVNRVEQHGSPSVAFYQAVHDVSTGKTLIEAANELSIVLSEAKKDKRLTKAADELESALDLAIRTAGVADWMGRGVNWLGKAFDPIAEQVDRFNMGAMGTGGPIVDAALKIRQQAAKIHEIIKWARTGDTTKTGLDDFGISMLGPIKKDIDNLAWFAKNADITIPNYDALCSHLVNGRGLTAGNVEEFAATFSAVFRLTENQALLQKMYQAYLKRQKSLKMKNKPSALPAPAAAPKPGEGAAAPKPAAPAKPGPGEVDVGPEFVGNFMGAVEKIRPLSPKQFNTLRSLVNKNLMRSKQLEAPQLTRQQPKAAGSQWSIKTAAVNLKFMIEEVMESYQRLMGKPLLDDAQQQQLIQTLVPPKAEVVAPPVVAPAPPVVAPAPPVVAPAPPVVAPAPVEKTDEPVEAPLAPENEVAEAEKKELAAFKDRIANRVLEGLQNLPDDQVAKLAGDKLTKELLSVKLLLLYRRDPTPENVTKMKNFIKGVLEKSKLEKVLNNPAEITKILSREDASPVVKLLFSIMSGILLPKQAAPADVAKKAPA